MMTWSRVRRGFFMTVPMKTGHEAFVRGRRGSWTWEVTIRRSHSSLPESVSHGTAMTARNAKNACESVIRHATRSTSP